MNKKSKQERNQPSEKLKPKAKPFYSSSLWQKIIIASVGIIFYANTIQNEFALDDGLVFMDNQFVRNGVAGIPDIFSYDTFYGTLGKASELNGGRYRPLSLAVFAMEYDALGEEATLQSRATLGHLLNILFYILTGLALFAFLRNHLFPPGSFGAFAATLLFMVHPIHTEVVANVKGLDEILSFLFLVIALNKLLNYAKGKSGISALIISMLLYALALLAKENGLMFILIFPLTIYFFSNKPWKAIAKLSIPFWVIAVLYFALRYAMIGFKNQEVTEVMDNPYLFASASQKIATIAFVFLDYFRLFFYPLHLTWDYSYNQVPYRYILEPVVLFSMVCIAAITFFAVIKTKNKSVFAWCIWFYLLSMFIVSNVAVNVGSPMNERFLYQSGVAICIAVVFLFIWIIEKIKMKKSFVPNLAGLLLIALVLLAGFRTYSRNKDWKNNFVLHTTDVNTSANSARSNCYAGISLINKSDDKSLDSTERRNMLLSAVAYFHIAIKIQPEFLPATINLGGAYFRLDSMDKAAACWDYLQEREPQNKLLVEYFSALGNAYLSIARKKIAVKNLPEAISPLRKSVHYAPGNVESWAFLGGCYFDQQRNLDSAVICWKKTLELNPNQEDALRGKTFLTATGKWKE